MSWGIRITILTLGFVGFMSFLVIKSMQQNFDLVAEDYYQQELAYQDNINKRINQQRNGVLIELLDDGKEVIVKFPGASADSLIQGNITFFYPADSGKDLTKSISLSHGQQTFSKKVLSHGLYKVKIDYQINGQAYYYENTMML